MTLPEHAYDRLRVARTVSHHEMDHALLALSLPGTDSMCKVPIIPRGIGVLGNTMQRPTGDRFLMTRRELQNKMPVWSSRRAAEHIIFAYLSTGMSANRAQVTDIARSMVMRYGMDPRLGHAVTRKSGRPCSRCSR